MPSAAGKKNENTFALKALGKTRPPFINVVTDMVTKHALWFDDRADLIVVPTETARLRSIRYQIMSEKVCVVGLAVAYRYCQPLVEKSILRQTLGWPLKKPLVLLLGGGEGMGPLAQTAHSIFFFLLYRPQLIFTLFPYTTLFR